jgi:hypothetical protein
MWSGGYWNDVGPTLLPDLIAVRRIGYLVEFSIPEPSGFCLVGALATTLFIFGRNKFTHHF